MAQRCEICGKGPVFGNRVSHAHNVTSRRWRVNLRSVRVQIGKIQKRMRVCAECIRSGRTRQAA